MKKSLTLIVAIFLLGWSVQAQLLRHNFDPQGQTYIQASLRGQFWIRYTQTNPGTTINSEPTTQMFDFSIRRYRIGLQAQVNPKLYFFMLLGGNNINQQATRPYHIRMLDLYAEYTFNKAIAIGIGKISWGGPSRYTIFSNAAMLNLDPVVFELFTLDRTDDLGRNLGIYAKGQIKKIDYTIALLSPTRPTTTQINEGYAQNRQRLRFSSYIKYQFLEKESNKNPFSGGVGTYLGTKKIFNLGIGYVQQPKMMEQNTNNSHKYYDYKNIGIDLFIDLPISQQNDAITFYASHNKVNFGPNYIRNVAANSIFDSTGTSFNAGGNAYPMIGTGKMHFFQLGYLLAKNSKNKTRYQPNMAINISDFEKLNQKSILYDLGMNIYFDGQRSKLSLGYQNRPIYDATTLKVSQRKGMYVLQYQIQI